MCILPTWKTNIFECCICPNKETSYRTADTVLNHVCLTLEDKGMCISEVALLTSVRLSRLTQFVLLITAVVNYNYTTIVFRGLHYYVVPYLTSSKPNRKK